MEGLAGSLFSRAGLKSPISTSSSSNGELYNHDGKNWYKSLPYAFRANINGQRKIFYLPISPQNLQITTHFATNTIATLYSTVEEHSEQRYFDIVIQGTTGFTPRYVAEGGVQATQRPAYQSGEIFSSVAGGFFSSTLGKLDKALNRASDAVNSLRGEGRKFQTGVFADNNGYVAFHNLYKFFLQYKQAASKGLANPSSVLSNVPGSDFAKSLSSSNSNDRYPLQFINYKDGNQYSCTIQRFTLERSAENPMLYNYTIQLRAYNLSPLTSSFQFDTKQRLAELGLGQDKASFASRFKNGVSGAKQSLSALRGALKTAGR